MIPWYFAILVVIALLVLFTVPGKIITFQSTPTHLIIGRRRPEAPPVLTLATQYPHASFGSAIDDLTGMSVIELHVKDWAYVRAMELDIYGWYWHTSDGECLAAGITPLEEAEQEANCQAMEAAKIELAKAIREDREAQQRPCYCNYCHGRAGVHNEDAVALYQAQCKAAMAQVSAPQSWWAAKMAELDYTVEDPTPDDVARVRANWKDLVAAAEAEQQPTPPWGAEIDSVLRAGGMELSPDNLVRWEQQSDRDGTMIQFTAHYQDGSYVKLRNDFGRWHPVEFMGPRRGSLPGNFGGLPGLTEGITNALRDRGIVS